MLSVVPMCVAGELVLPVIGKMLFSTAGVLRSAHLLVSSDVEVVLIGETALEILVLKVDPVREA
jgi:predicted aspartyl protease